MSAVYSQVHFRLDFFMEANNMNPDQTGDCSNLGPYCCKIGYLRGADDKSYDWWAKGKWKITT